MFVPVEWTQDDSAGQLVEYDFMIHFNDIPCVVCWHYIGPGYILPKLTTPPTKSLQEVMIWNDIYTHTEHLNLPCLCPSKLDIVLPTYFLMTPGVQLVSTPIYSTDYLWN